MDKNKSRKELLDNIVIICRAFGFNTDSENIREFYSNLLRNKKGRDRLRYHLQIWSRSPSLQSNYIQRRILTVEELLFLLYGVN